MKEKGQYAVQKRNLSGCKEVPWDTWRWCHLICLFHGLGIENRN